MKRIARHPTAIAAALCGMLVLGAAALSPRDVVVFNRSPSMPPGFYVRIEAEPEIGAVVTVRARDVAPGAAHARRFEDASDRFIKRVAAAGGARVCAEGGVLSVDGAARARALSGTAQRLGWSGCLTFRADQVLLLGESADSFDGRYWGPKSVDLIEGVWRKFGLQAQRNATACNALQRF